MQKIIPVAIITLIGSNALAADLIIKVEVPKLDVAEYHKPYVALWIENLTKL